MLPERLSPFVEIVPSPHVIDEDVEPSPLPPDSPNERPNFVWPRVVGSHGDSGSTRCRDQLRGLVDRFRSSGRGARSPGASPRAVHDRPGLAERARDAASGAASGAGDERDLSRQRASSTSHESPPWFLNSRLITLRIT